MNVNYLPQIILNSIAVTIQLVKAVRDVQMVFMAMRPEVHLKTVNPVRAH